MVIIFGVGLAVMKFVYTQGQRGTLASATGSNPTTNTLNWCADNVVDVSWVSEDVPENLKKMKMADLRETYCELKTEAFSSLDLDKIEWLTLAESAGATGIRTVLEWNPQAGLFRTAGLPFKSSSLSRDLQK